MLPYLLLAVVVIITSYIIIFTYRQKEKVTCTSGMMIAMTVAMNAGFYIGTILGVLGQHRMTEPTVFAVIISLIIGYLTGRPFSIMAVLDGMMAGVMGGMMGAMLGVMVFNQSPEWILLLMGLLFLLFKFLIWLWLKNGADEHFTLSPRMIWLIIPPLLLFIGLFLTFSDESREEVANWCNIPAGFLQKQGETFGDVQIKDGIQEVQIQVLPNGYTPNHIEMKAGLPIKLRFINYDTKNCASHLVSKELGIEKFLDLGETVIEIPPLKSGTYSFHCEMNMFFGKLVIQP